ncbi:MAG: ABC transporter permease [Betaproteobacteria bacterium]|nr:ABC transporter permease [Betaproteobacteria bacterium]
MVPAPPVRLLQRIVGNRRSVVALARRHLLARYAGTLLGGLWEVLHPALTILVLWFVFTAAFHARGPHDMPFILYFVTGIVPWLLISESINQGTQGVVAHGFLIKKMVFPSEILPFVYLVASAVSHVLLLGLAAVVLLANGVPASIFWIQCIYYFVVACGLVLGIQWLLSALMVFHRDLGQVVGVLLNLAFWATPVVWVPNGVVPPRLAWILYANPFAYVIDGYRKSLLERQPFWTDWAHGLYVWTVLLALLVVGGTVFRRLKPHFADVL